MSRSRNKGDTPTLGTNQTTTVPVFKYKRQPARRPLAATLRLEVMQRDNFHCQRCGAGQETGAKLEVDHITPISRGGTNDPHNLQTLCRICNLAKSNYVVG